MSDSQGLPAGVLLLVKPNYYVVLCILPQSMT